MKDLNWYVVRTATRQEKRALSSLDELKVEYYMPLATRWKRTARSKEKVYTPLFPGYLFALLSDADIHRVIAADCVHAVVGGTTATGEMRPLQVPADAVELIRSRESKGEFDKTKPSTNRFVPARGETVRISGGTFMGYLATVIEEVGATAKSVRLQLHGLGGGAMSLSLDKMAPAA